MRRKNDITLRTHAIRLEEHAILLTQHVVRLRNHDVLLLNDTVLLRMHAVLRDHEVLTRKHDVRLRNHEMLLRRHAVLRDHEVLVRKHEVRLRNHEMLLRRHGVLLEILHMLMWSDSDGSIPVPIVAGVRAHIRRDWRAVRGNAASCPDERIPNLWRWYLRRRNGSGRNTARLLRSCNNSSNMNRWTSHAWVNKTAVIQRASDAVDLGTRLNAVDYAMLSGIVGSRARAASSHLGRRRLLLTIAWTAALLDICSRGRLILLGSRNGFRRGRLDSRSGRSITMLARSFGRGDKACTLEVVLRFDRSGFARSDI
ncbi:hypothetical protein QBC43DRAFT_39338 [Cladorrhinum sp. PSN259]|nr:hypothetical protein QBC43DRAFT_39338 [Cladorrhinum sp. PSN259]